LSRNGFNNAKAARERSLAQKAVARVFQLRLHADKRRVVQSRDYAPLKKRKIFVAACCGRAAMRHACMGRLPCRCCRTAPFPPDTARKFLSANSSSMPWGMPNVVPLSAIAFTRFDHRGMPVPRPSACRKHRLWSRYSLPSMSLILLPCPFPPRKSDRDHTRGNCWQRRAEFVFSAPSCALPPDFGVRFSYRGDFLFLVCRAFAAPSR